MLDLLIIAQKQKSAPHVISSGILKVNKEINTLKLYVFNNNDNKNTYLKGSRQKLSLL